MTTISKADFWRATITTTFLVYLTTLQPTALGLTFDRFHICDLVDRAEAGWRCGSPSSVHRRIPAAVADELFSTRSHVRQLFGHELYFECRWWRNWRGFICIGKGRLWFCGNRDRSWGWGWLLRRGTKVLRGWKWCGWGCGNHWNGNGIFFAGRRREHSLSRLRLCCNRTRNGNISSFRR